MSFVKSLKKVKYPKNYKTKASPKHFCIFKLLLKIIKVITLKS